MGFFNDGVWNGRKQCPECEFFCSDSIFDGEDDHIIDVCDSDPKGSIYPKNIDDICPYFKKETQNWKIQSPLVIDLSEECKPIITFTYPTDTDL